MPLLPAASSFACIAVFAGLLELGRWQTDEYLMFSNLQEGGWHAVWPRLAFAPRPVSETLLFVYGALANGLGCPLTVPFLAVLWALALIGMSGAAWLALPQSRGRIGAAAALGASPIAFILATSDVTEVFYWPVAAAAYLPLGASATALMLLLAAPAPSHAWCFAALVAAAGSTEIGAVFAAAFAVLAAAEAATRLPRPATAAVLRGGLWWLAPGLLGAAVIVVILMVRARTVASGADAQPYTGHLLASLATAVRQAGAEALTGASSVAEGWRPAADAAFALGYAGTWRMAGRCSVPGRLAAVLAGALAVAAAFSLWAAYYHYGTPCCERQATVRHWFMTLLLVLGASHLIGRWPALAMAPGVPAAAILTLSLLPVLARSQDLRAAYGLLPLARDGTARTWRAGALPDDAMEFYLPPDSGSPVVRGTAHLIGRYEVGGASDAPVMLREMGRYFGKATIHVCQPWQTRQSLLQHGQFIPACPPHDGPPDVIYPPP